MHNFSAQKETAARVLCVHVHSCICARVLRARDLFVGYDRRRAEFARWTSGLEQWLGSLPQEPLPARFEQMNRLDNLGTPSRQATRKGGPATTAAPSPARIAVRRI